MQQLSHIMSINIYMRSLTCIVLISICANNLLAQQLPLYSNYADNTFLINPAFAGNDGFTTFNLTDRFQWVGIAEAPRTHSFSVQGRVLKRKFTLKNTFSFLKGSGPQSTRDRTYVAKKDGRIGIGGYIFNDRVGLYDRTGLQFSYVYHTFFRQGQLSMGLSTTMFQFKIDRNRLYARDPDDPILVADGMKNAYIPDFGLGFYWTAKKYYVGLSTLHLSQAILKIGNQSLDSYQLNRHYYLLGGYNYEIDEYLTLTPSIIMKTPEHFKFFQCDFGLRLSYIEKYWLGLAYRTNADLVVIVGMKVDKFLVSYSFDYPRNPIRQHSLGSHEVSISMKLGSAERRYRWKERY